MHRTGSRTLVLFALVTALGCGSTSPRPAAVQKTPIGQEQLLALLVHPGPMPDGLIYTDPDHKLWFSHPRAFYPIERLVRVDLSRVRVLDIGDIDTAGVDLLCPRLTNIESVQIDCGSDLVESTEEIRLDDAVAQRLIACPALRSMRRLALLGCRVGDETARAIAEADLPALINLGLWNGSLTPTGVEHFTRNPIGQRLVKLSLRGQGLGDRALATLIASGLLTRAKVNLSRNDITDESARQLLDLGVDEIKMLDLEWNMKVSEELSARLHAKFGDRIEAPWESAVNP